MDYWNEVQLDECLFAYEIVERGQHILGIDYIEIVDYMKRRGFPDRVINACFRLYSGWKDIVVTS